MGKKIFSLQYKFLLITLCITIASSILVGALSYNQSVSIIDEKVSQSNFNTIMQMSDNINSILGNMESAAVDLWRNEELMRSLQLTAEVTDNLGVHSLNVQTVLNSFVVLNPLIYSIYVRGYNGISHDTANATNIISSEFEEQLIALKGRGVFIKDTISDWDNNHINVISFVRIFRNPHNFGEELGIVKINVREDTLANVFGDSELFYGGQTMIVDSDYSIVSALEKETIGTSINGELLYSEHIRGSSGFFTQEIDRQELMVTYSGLAEPNWKLLNIVPVAELTQGNIIIRNITVMAVILGSILCLLISLLVSNFVLKPLKNLSDSMRELEHENFEIVLPERGNDEIALVCRSFNKMSGKLNELINQVYIGQLKQKEAELKALHEQINPHFLYNTLNTIYWVCQLEKAKKSGDLVKALSKLFRLSLNSGNEVTSIEKEIEHLNYYISIQKVRFGENIRFNIEVDKSILERNVLKLILQPLVENAILHGIEQKDGKGEVNIKVFAAKDAIVYQVEDTGVGADVEELYKLLDKVQEDNRGFGIKSVNDRVKFHYGEEYGIQFYSDIGKGLKVIVTQPLGGIFA